MADFFPDKDIFDLGFDVLPRIVGNTSGYIIEDYLLDIGTPEKLCQAESDIRSNVFGTRTSSKILIDESGGLKH